ncbi:MAG: TIGR03792 family protein [Leptolyngbyaceae bacterium]|nr:TIGR03792 family protein [Leptolyngbyaceae bacterium]
MVIEWLRFRVQEDLREQFVRLDEEIWTAALSQYDGFLGKEVWISADDLTEVISVIRWDSTDSWYSIPNSDLDRINAQFDEAMGSGVYELFESKAYQVRKFLSSGDA